MPERISKEGFLDYSLGRKTFRVLVKSRGGYRLVLARDTRKLREILWRAQEAFLLAFPLALAVASVGGWLVSGYALRPVRAIAAAAEKISPHALHGRVEVPSDDPDLARLAQILNEMWERIEKAFVQEQRLTADASHELRTPLTILRNQLEAALAEAGGRQSSEEEVFLCLLEQVKRLSTITDNLLFLSQAECGQIRIRRERIAWSVMVAEVAEDARLLAGPAGLSVAASVAPGLCVYGDGDLLMRMLWNLTDNAVKYNADGGFAWITLSEDGPWIVLSIANTGPTIEAGDQAEIFRRFYRTQAAREGRARGSGLGLSLCREIVAAHQGEIRYDSPSEGWNRFTVWLPKGGSEEFASPSIRQAVACSSAAARPGA
ncbi:Copper sensor histidine kinase (fragment) [Methylacidimicrobium sp. AP8]|uniref:sensor histidine kinase n=1 Tax=Methylacidimicrobium sp. AP8 TaxID=2730359 RepID=UPI0018BFABEA